jgi:hypothetical protein
MNHGQLLETRNAELDKLSLDDGQPLSGQGKEKKWVLLTVQDAACDARCQRKLYLMRQIRTAQNNNMVRLERVWLVTGNEKPDPALLAVHPGLRLARTADSGWVRQMPSGPDLGAHIFLIDPMGNYVLRYDDHSASKGMLKDLNRLLKRSTIG